MTTLPLSRKAAFSLVADNESCLQLPAIFIKSLSYWLYFFSTIIRSFMAVGIIEP
jgi:hypothetical protein